MKNEDDISLCKNINVTQSVGDKNLPKNDKDLSLTTEGCSENEGSLTEEKIFLKSDLTKKSKMKKLKTKNIAKPSFRHAFKMSSKIQLISKKMIFDNEIFIDDNHIWKDRSYTIDLSRKSLIEKQNNTPKDLIKSKENLSSVYLPSSPDFPYIKKNCKYS